MKSIKIEPLLFGGAKKHLISLLVRSLLYTLIIMVVTGFCLYMSLYKDNYTSFYSKSVYDYFIQETDQQQIEEMSQMNCVEGIFPFSLMIFQLDKSVNSADNDGVDIAFLTAGSFEGLEYSTFSPDNLISEDKDILENEEKNPIIIDYSLSKSEGISVGDDFTLYSERAFGGMTKKFTVGAVYKNHCEFANYDVVILVNDRINSDMLQLDPNAGYSLAYVKASDISAFDDYLENEFYPHLSFGSRAEFDTLSADLRSGYYESSDERLKNAEKDLDFSGIGMIVIAAAAFIVLILLIKREHEKCIENNMYSIAVMYSLGLKKRTILIKLFKNSFIPVTIAVVTACIMNKFVIFNRISKGLYVPAENVLIYGAVSLAAAFIVILVLTLVFTTYKISSERVLELIGNEKRA